MTYRPKAGEQVWIFSMGKRFALTAITDNNAEANAYMEKHDNDAVIACFGSLVFIANKYEAVR